VSDDCRINVYLVRRCPLMDQFNTQNFLIGCVYTSSRPSASHGFNIWLVDVEGVVGGRVGGKVEGEVEGVVEVDGRHVTRSP